MADKPPILDQQPAKQPPIILDYETPKPQPAKPVLPLIVRIPLGILGAYLTLGAAGDLFFAMFPLSVRYFGNWVVTSRWRLFGAGMICAIIAFFLWKAILWKRRKRDEW